MGQSTKQPHGENLVTCLRGRNLGGGPRLMPHEAAASACYELFGLPCCRSNLPHQLHALGLLTFAVELFSPLKVLHRGVGGPAFSRNLGGNLSRAPRRRSGAGRRLRGGERTAGSFLLCRDRLFEFGNACAARSGCNRGRKQKRGGEDDGTNCHGNLLPLVTANRTARSG